MTYRSYRITKAKNAGNSKLTFGTLCAACEQPILEGQPYIVHAMRTATMRVSGFHYYHVTHAPKHGSGWGDFLAGNELTNLDDVKDGDVLLEHALSCDSFNVIRILKTRWPAEPKHLIGLKLYGLYVNPSQTSQQRLQSDVVFCVWGHELGCMRRLYRATEPAPMRLVHP